MKRFALTLLGFVLSSSAGAGHAQSTFAEKPPGVEPIVTRDRLFSIPFFLNPRQRRPDELFLYVSGNQGKEWSLYQRRGPNQEKFDFQAGAEGEFWFVIRTPYSGSAPGVYDRPEKIVVVDESKPELDVNLQLGATGQVKAEWTASDPYLDTSTFKLSYQGPNDDQWRPVTVRLPVSSGDDTFAGEVSWAVSGQDGKILVRAEVQDRAGNSSVFQDGVVLNPVALHTTSSEDLPSKSSTYRTNSDLPFTLDSDEPQLPPAANDPVANEMVTQPDLGAASSFSSHNHGWRTTGVSQPGSDPFGNSFGLVDPIMDPLDAVSRANARPVQGEYPPPVANQVFPNQTPAPSQAVTPASEMAAAEPPLHVTNSRRFNLDYEISDTGDSGVARVELWITKDDGRSWVAFGVDEDRQSPFQVELESEGQFGFRLLIHNGLGASSRPPQPGEAADLRVSVDWSSPQGEILAAKFGEGAQKNQLYVTWQIADENLGETPIQLSYADRPNGPWMPLDRPVANSGRDQWQLDFRLPPQIYLKMDVRDRAGNAAVIQYSRPVRTVGLPPSGRIRAVRPIEGL